MTANTIDAPTVYAAVDAAAAPTLERMEKEARRLERREAKPPVLSMLEYIRLNLLDEKLNVKRAKEACAIRDNSIAIHFHAVVGLPPHAYISECRLEIARRLLSSTRLAVFQISDCLGYSSIQVFSRAFYRSLGVRPTEYRRQQATGNQTAVSEIESVERLRRVMSGRGTAGEACALIAQLSRMYSTPATYGAASSEEVGA